MSTDLTPEHSARPFATLGYPEVEAAYRYVDSVVQHADAISPCGGHAWHGWALREAFLAGCTHHRENGGYIVPTPVEVAWKEAPPEVGAEGCRLDPSCDELNELWNSCGTGDEYGHHQGNIFDYARAVLLKWGRPVALAVKQAPPERLEQFSSATETLGRHLDELCEEHFRAGLKAGSMAALESLMVGLKREWTVRLAFRISPMVVLREFKEGIEKKLPLDRGSEDSLPVDHSSEFYPLG